jgi:hypothetical protein
MGRSRGHYQSGMAVLLLSAAAQACLAQVTPQADAIRARGEELARASAEARNLRVEEQARADALKAIPLKAAPIDAVPWRQVTPEELAMTAEPRAPGAAAIYLYTQIDQDQQNRYERIYQQIKVLGEEGRDRASIQLPYSDPLDTIDGIAARVIQPDGTVVEFRDEVYDRPLAVNRATGWRAKSFTLPDVRVGSVIEYQYHRRWQSTTLTSRWVLSQDLYTRQARYAMQHPSFGNLQWSWPQQLPPGTAQPVLENGAVRMEIRDVPAFVIEPFMPPLSEMTVHVEFHWLVASTDARKYWRDFGIASWESAGDFIGKPRDVADVLAGIIVPTDAATQKAMKIYEHVRHMRNVWTENPALRPDRDVELVRKAKDVRSVAKNGFGTSNQLQLYFIALARAAGLDATPVMLASRQESFFDASRMEADQLDKLVVALQLDGREVLLDPAGGDLPFGKLFWSDTGVPGLKLDKDGGQWIQTPAPRSVDAGVTRKAALEMSADGVLEGTLEVRYSGHEAAWRIRNLRYRDEEIRRQFLQDDVRQSLATEAEVTLVREPDWNDRDGTIEVAYQIKLPEWVTPSGSRMLVGVGLFGALEKWMFISPERQHPIYIEYPVTVEDQIEITLPQGFSVQSAPAALPATDPAFVYSLSVTPREGAVSIRRTMAHGLFLVPAVHYPRIRTFFQGVRSGDESQVVITR